MMPQLFRALEIDGEPLQPGKKIELIMEPMDQQ
jgi:hypothetical protein